MRRAIGVVISGLRRSIWLSWSKSLYETSLRPCSSITSEYSSAGVRTSLNPNSLNRSRIRSCTSSNRVDSGGSTSRVPGVVANFRGGSRSIGEAILTDGRSLDGPIESAGQATRSLRFPELPPVLGCPATIFGAGCERRQARRYGGWGLGIIRVAELVGVMPEIVQLFLAVRVLYVLAPAASADTRIRRGRTTRSAGFKQDGAPPGGGVPLEHRQQGSPIHVARNVRACQVREGWQEVGVEGQLLGLVTGRDTRTTHQERDANVFLVGTPLPPRYAMFSHVEAVVRGEEDVGVGEHTLALQFSPDSGHEVVEGLQRFGPLFGAVVYLRLFGIAEPRQLSYPGGLV